MKRAIVAVVLMLAACGSEGSGGDSGMTGEGWCCDGTESECNAQIEGDGRCFYAGQGCSPDGRALCVRGGTGSVCTRGSGLDSLDSEFAQTCSKEGKVLVAIIAADKDGTPTQTDIDCITADEAAGCF